MKLYRYWAAAEGSATDIKGRRLKLKKWAGSNDSASAAKTAAEQALRELSSRLASFDVNEKKYYAYSQRGLPEELIGEPGASSGVTRNRYGALVLNAADAVFIDVDLRMGNGLLARLFGKTEEKYLGKLEAWLAARAATGNLAGARVYRTARGLRYLLTHGREAVNEGTMRWLEELGSDKLYMTLCRAQGCYRARLSPKPWRVKAELPPNQYPRETPADQAKFRDWLGDYERKSRDYAVCRFVRTLGTAPVHGDLAKLVRDHDAATRAETDLPLA
jgi:hypothetical protein